MNSWSWPNLFDVSRSTVNIYNDTKSITNRVKLLMLTEPTELYMNPTFGVGLKKYLFTYNNDNTIALIREKLIEQLSIWEPDVIADKTIVKRKDGSELEGDQLNPNTLRLNVTLTTVANKTVSFSIDENDYSRFI